MNPARSMNSITLMIKPSWGKKRYYPACETSNFLCSLIKRNKGTAICLTPWQLDLIKDFGIDVTFVTEEP
jgi:hypothetical protein